MSRRGQAYVWAVVVAGSASIGLALHELISSAVPSRQWLPLALLTLVSGLATVKLPGVPALISVSETFLFSTVLLFGPAPGVMTVVFDASFMSLRRGRQPISQLLFNFGAPALSLWWAAKLFYLTAGIKPLYLEPTDIRYNCRPTTLVYRYVLLFEQWLNRMCNRASEEHFGIHGVAKASALAIA